MRRCMARPRTTRRGIEHETYVNALVVGVLNTNAMTVTTTWSPNNKPGSVVTVVVAYNFPPLTSLVSSVTIPLTRTAAMVITQ